VAFVFDRVFEAAMALLVASGSGRTSRKQALTRLRSHLGRVVPLTERLYRGALDARAGAGGPDVVVDLLLRFACGHGEADLPALDGRLAARVDGILNAVLKAPRAVEAALFLDQDPDGLTDLIAGVSTEHRHGDGGADGGADGGGGDGAVWATLKATRARPFPRRPPSGYTAYFSPCCLAEGFANWSATAVTVRLPSGAAPGPVWLARKIDEVAGQAALAAFAASLTAAGHISPADKIPLLTVPLCRLPIVAKTGTNVATFTTPPLIESFWVGDERGDAVAGRPIAAGDPIVVEWRAGSGAAPEATSVIVTIGDQQVKVSTLLGRLLAHPRESGAVTITVTNPAGSVSTGTGVVVEWRLVFEQPFACVTPGRISRLQITTNPHDVPPAFVAV